jgi:squalene-associated FAD-dependent desaturase
VTPRRVVVVGGGWAGLAAAVRARERGAEVTLLEASRSWGGRARRIDASTTSGVAAALDNGQHILIGAYVDTLGLLERLGCDVAASFEAVPLDLRYADGQGLATPAWARRWPAPLDTLAAIATARGWAWRDKGAFLWTAARWQRQGFRCPPDWTVNRLCAGLPQRVVQDVIEPLCVAALNTPADRASAQVFLTVLRDALLGQGHKPWRASTLLLPRQDLGRLLPDAAVAWLLRQGAALHLGHRVSGLTPAPTGWRVETAEGHWLADEAILACPSSEAARLVADLFPASADWAELARGLQHEPIATVYLQGVLHHPWPSHHGMVALRSGPDAPAQYAFHRTRLLGPTAAQANAGPVVLALVASACTLERQTLEHALTEQARQQLGLLEPILLQTVVEKRATFACTPGLRQPPPRIAPGLHAAGDYVQSPYPATLESAVRSGLYAANALTVHSAEARSGGS